MFAICIQCRARLVRLPATFQDKQYRIAIRRIADRPDAYPVKTLASSEAATLFTYLVADLPPLDALASLDP